jgi:hypothetical protein
LAVLVSFVVPSVTRSESNANQDEPKGATPSSYDQIAPVLQGKETFQAVMARDKADKGSVMARQKQLLEERYNLTIKLRDRSGNPAPGWVVVNKAGDFWPGQAMVDGETTLRVPPGTYTLDTALVVPGSRPDRLGMALAVSGISFPAFALGMVLMQIFAVQLNWLPTVGADSWRHYILPSLTLGAAVAAIMARFTRSSFVEILQEDYVRTARAKGLAERTVVVKHGLRNALIPVVTMMGLQFGFLLGGSIVVEVVFNWPGMGRLLVDAVDMRDYPVIQAEILLFSLEFILINLIVDVLYAVINPSIRYR